MTEPKLNKEKMMQSAREHGMDLDGNPVAYEFYNPATGHAIVDYSRWTHAGHLTERDGYRARPLVYAAYEQAGEQQADSVHLAAPSGQGFAASRGEAAGDRTAAPTQQEPLPCPFCGDVPVLIAETERDGYVREYTVHCDNCAIGMSDEYDSHAIAAWNRRAPTGQSRTFEAGEATCASNEPDEQDTAALPLPQPTGERE